MKFRQPSLGSHVKPHSLLELPHGIGIANGLGTKAAIFLPFLISCTPGVFQVVKTESRAARDCRL